MVFKIIGALHFFGTLLLAHTLQYLNVLHFCAITFLFCKFYTLLHFFSFMDFQIISGITTMSLERHHEWRHSLTNIFLTFQIYFTLLARFNVEACFHH